MNSNPPVLEWCERATCSFSASRLGSNTICRIFDYDNCLVYKFTSNPLPSVINTLRHIARDRGTDIVIISNQKGISVGKTTHVDVRRRFQEFSDRLNDGLPYDEVIRLSIIYSTATDIYRKPHTGMFTLWKEIVGGQYRYTDVQYSGDAAGRLKSGSGTGIRKKDFSNSDLLFAMNCGLPFVIPEEIFRYGNSPPLPTFRETKWPVRQIMPPPPVSDGPIVVILVGPQGIGKSTFAQKWSEDTGMRVISQDILRRKKKVYSEFLKEMKAIDGKGVIIDNTNKDDVSRRRFVDVAISMGCKTVCCWWDVPKPLSFHMCDVRVELGGMPVPPVAIHIYYKRMEPPCPEDYTEFHHFKGLIEPEVGESGSRFEAAFEMRFN